MDPAPGPSTEPSTKKSAKRKQRTSERTFAEIAWELVKKEDGMFLCNIDPSSSCDRSQTNYESGNFIRHFRMMHTDLAVSCGLVPDPAKIPKKKARVVPKRLCAIDSQQYVEGCTRLVTNHNLPLSCFEWKGLRLLTDPISQAVGTSVNRKNIKPHLRKMSERVMLDIKQEMRGRLISIKIDSAQRHYRHILGINVQYEVKNKVVTRTLGKIFFN